MSDKALFRKHAEEALKLTIGKIEAQMLTLKVQRDFYLKRLNRLRSDKSFIA